MFAYSFKVFILVHVHIHLMEQLNCGKTNSKNFFKAQNNVFPPLLLIFQLGFYYFNFSFFFVFNFFRTHMFSQDVSKWLSTSRRSVGVNMVIFYFGKTLSFYFRNPCTHMYFWTIFNVLKHARGCLKRAVVVCSEYFIHIKWQKVTF